MIPTQPQKKSKKYLFLVIPAILILLAGLGFLGFQQFLNHLYSPIDPTDSSFTPFVIETGETATTIAQRLQQAGFIRNDTFTFYYFRYLVKERNLLLQAGSYELSKTWTMGEIAEALTLGKIKEEKVTILEGWRLEQIAEYLSTTDFPEFRGEEASIRNELSSKLKEGYFFPDTYQLSLDSTLSDLLKMVQTKLNTILTPQMQSDFNKENLTEDQGVILASIVEREARSAESRKIVAGILLKRLQNEWPLEADATVQYVMATQNCAAIGECDWWPKDITEQDLKIDSPYNTRLYKGLPPTPICNPSQSALEAVANPTQTEYWFYLTGNDGQMHYAKTLEEHNQNINLYL